MITNIIACPGGDFCSLANAKSIPVAQAIQERFDDLDYVYDIGELDLNISGCMNSCGHHHVGHIGILGVDKDGEEWYQISIGGNQGLTRPGAPAAVGKVIGPSFAREQIPDVIEKLIEVYLERRESEDERFIDVVWRIGIEPFKERVYGNHHQRQERRQPIPGSGLSWRPTAACPAIPPAGDIIVPLALWRAQREALLARAGPHRRLAGQPRGAGGHRRRPARISASWR